MAATLGKLPEFSPDGGNFEVFLERFELFTALNGIADDRKRQLFLTTIGEEAYLTLRRLLFPKAPIEASFEEATNLLKNHYSPRRSVLPQRCRFSQRNQEPDETVTDFIVAIKAIAAQCEFGDSLQEALRDRLIAGLRSDAVRRRILAMPDEEVSWERACSIATEMEAAVGVTEDVPASGDGVAGEASTGAACSVPCQQTSPRCHRPGTSVEPETPRSPNPEAPQTVSSGEHHQQPAVFPDIHDQEAEGFAAKDVQDEGTSSSSSPYYLAEPLGQTKEAVKEMAGQFRGLQGHHSSSYIDATLFAMFSCTFTFDDLLVRPRADGDIEDYEDIQEVLREDIVQVLRRNKYVPRENVMRLRRLLDLLGAPTGFTTEEKDPEEFLHCLFHALRVPPFLIFGSYQDTHLYQLWAEKNEDLRVPSVEQLFHLSIHESNIKLKKVPKALILQMPRSGRHFRLYDLIVPSLELDITDALDDSMRSCYICGRQASVECRDCFQPLVGLESTSYCDGCSRRVHRQHKEQTHQTTELPDGPESARAASGRTRLSLFAVVCIETSHYVSFVKCHVGDEKYTWCFFDSMADHEGGQEGRNIPRVEQCLEAGRLWSEDCRDIVLLARDTNFRLLPTKTRRLFCDAYIYMYECDFAQKYS